MMICHRCGSTQLQEQTTDLPFKLDVHKILIIKELPAMVCNSCGETMLSDAVMVRVDQIINQVRPIKCELDVVSYAA